MSAFHPLRSLAPEPLPQSIALDLCVSGVFLPNIRVIKEVIDDIVWVVGRRLVIKASKDFVAKTINCIPVDLGLLFGGQNRGKPGFEFV
jgi:hypothetical protein